MTDLTLDKIALRLQSCCPSLTLADASVLGRVAINALRPEPSEGPTEPIITINGRILTSSQAMTVRVAISSLHAEMGTPGALGDDMEGKQRAAAYRQRLTEVLAFTL